MPRLLLADDQIPHDLAVLERQFAVRLSAGTIDAAGGLVRGCTVAQAGVEAGGKFVLLDRDGKLTRDPEQAVRKLPVYTDDRTLETLMAAVTEAGGVLKVRSDHDDSLGARAGFADSFRLDTKGDRPRVAADLHLNESYRDREIFLETAQKTPALVGLSIDFAPTYELLQDRALMRVKEIFAVDIVDAGAITHDGLFLSRRVDNLAKLEIQTSTTMAKATETPKEPTMAEVLAQVSTLAETVGKCMEGLGALQKKMTAGKAAEGDGGEGGGDEEVPAEMSAAVKEVRDVAAGLKKDREAFNADREQLKKDREQLKADQAELAKTRAAMGLKNQAAAAADDAAGETERERLAREKAEGDKDYLTLVNEAKASGKFKKGSEAHEHVMRAHPEKYAAHMQDRGIVRMKRSA